MQDKTALLNQLRVDRSAERPARGRNWMIAAALVLVVVGGFWVTVAARTTDLPVHVATARSVSATATAPGSSVLEASGYVVARRVATVSAKTTGRVIELLVEEGQTVTKGQVLARLDDSNTRAQLAQAEAQLAQAEANYAASKVSFQDAEPTFRRSEKLHAQGLTSDDIFDAARMTFNAVANTRAVTERAVAVARANLAIAQQNQDDTVVRAPFSGVVTVKAAQAGDMVSPVSAGGGFTRTGICTIVDMQSLALDVDVNEKFISRIHPGQPATVALNAYADWSIPAEVVAVIPTADRAKATVRVRIGFKAIDPRILPEMGARVVVLEDAAKSAAPASAAAPAVLIPPDAVQANGDQGTVFVVADGVVERRAVRLGAKTPEGQLVLSGLSAGTSVVTGDLGALKDGRKVRVEE